jgi:amino acid adenylation domain-containing protein
LAQALNFFFWRTGLLPAETAECNKTEADYPRESTIAQLFERQVARTPDAVAVVSAGRSLTYRELDQRSNQLARHLRQFGVGRETLVGVAVERSVEMMVGLLAILKAGGAYVPMDPSYPARRIALMIEDSEAQVILATERTRSHLEKTARNIVSIDGDAAAIAGSGTCPVSSTVRGQNLAYVIYTSGSTGKPKGVMIEHRNVVNFFTGMDRAIGSDPGVWLAVTSISFDISVLELFWTLTRGFQVIIHGDEGTQTIPDEIRNYKVTHMQSTSSLARMVAVNPDGLSSLGRLKKLLLGGEALPPSLVRYLRQEYHGEMHNMYGPTETTIWSTTFRITGDSDSIPIGKPIANTQVYVLDSELQPVAAGKAGDLYIGGDGVVRGYWRRPDLTADKFLKDPFRPGNRMYRTGDIARFLPDGNLEFLGRADFQVKLRGFRIEIGEIEAALEDQAGVGQAVVVAIDFKSKIQTQTQTEDKRLVAYVIPKSGTRLEVAELRAALAVTLPEYMVPSNIVFLDFLPLTANGKIDRNALPHPSTLDNEASAAPELPRNELERMIAQAWKDALGVDGVGLNENFFDLGAHSLMVAEVHMQLQQLLGRELSLVDLFQFPTVTALANHLNGEEAAPRVSSRAERRLAARQQQAQRT